MGSTRPGQIPGGPVSADDLYNLPAGRDFELVRGELVKMTPAGARHEYVAGRVAARLIPFIEPHGLGTVLVSNAGFILSRNPDTVRAPDLAFVSRDRIPAAGVPESSWHLSPDLVVEVVSPSDKIDDVTAKAVEYLEAGTRIVWVVDPSSRSVTVWHSAQSSRTITASEELSGEHVLPGFTCQVAELFA